MYFPLEYGFGVIGLLMYLFSWFFLIPWNFESMGRLTFAALVTWVANALLTLQIVVWVVMLVKIVWSM